jgi:large conductance mechanosensitive channel
LAIAFVIGVALNTVVQAIVNDFIMPIIGAVTPGGSWKTFIWEVGPLKFGVGDFLSAVLNFIIIGFVAWRLSKLIPAAPTTATPAVKECPFCYSSIDARSTRCAHCTATL